jgi:UDP-glucose 4-epimerase
MFKNILVTGGAGYIGSHICNCLFNSGYKIFIIDNLSTGYKKLIKKQYNFLNADIGDFKIVSNYLKKNQIDLVVHLAASLSVEESMKNKKKYFVNNFLATKSLLRAIKKNNIKYIIFSSTCSVYGNQNGFVNEKTETNPINYYGKTKLMCENIIRKFTIYFINIIY